MKHKFIFGALAVVIVAIASVSVKLPLSTVSAHTTGSDWTSGADRPWAPYTHTPYFTQSGSYYFTDTTNLRWDTTRANALKNSGHRYTQDNSNGNNCTNEYFNATGNWGTNIPAPYYDRDNNRPHCTTTIDEAEITSETSSFPSTSQGYWTSIQWQRWYNGTGEMYFTSQASGFDWAMGEWNTHDYDLLYTRYFSQYGAMNGLNKLFAFFKAQVPSAFAHSEDSADSKDQDEEKDIHVEQRINSKAELDAYKNRAASDVKKLKTANVKKAKAVVTFNTPQSPENFVGFVKDNKVGVDSFEMRATDANGDKITIGGVSKDGVADPLAVFTEMKHSKSLKEVKGLTLKGVTSFEGTIEMADYEKLTRHPNIYFVDVSPEAVALDLQAADPSAKVEVNANDLFWYHEDYDL